MWGPVVPRLEAHHRVTFLDVPGFGDAPLPAHLSPSVESLALGVLEELRERGLEDAHVVGISLAGSVAIELARLGGGSTVTAFGPPGFWSSAGAAAVTAQVGGGTMVTRLARPLVALIVRIGPLAALILRRVVSHPERVPREVAAHLQLGSPQHTRHLSGRRLVGPLFRSLFRYRVRPLDGPVPVTVDWGDKDRLTPFRTQAARARQVLPHAHHVTLRDCGHIPTYDDPDQVAQVILESAAHA
jgi:pimeloyl-ACP methyl ester carboxylesterase